MKKYPLFSLQLFMVGSCVVLSQNASAVSQAPQGERVVTPERLRGLRAGWLNRVHQKGLVVEADIQNDIQPELEEADLNEAEIVAPMLQLHAALQQFRDQQSEQFIEDSPAAEEAVVLSATIVDQYQWRISGIYCAGGIASVILAWATYTYLYVPHIKQIESPLRVF